MGQMFHSDLVTFNIPRNLHPQWTNLRNIARYFERARVGIRDSI